MCGTQTLLDDGKETTTPSEISSTLKKKIMRTYFKKILQNLSLMQKAEITEDNLLVALKSMPNNKTRANNGQSKVFYETFWEDIKDVFINSLKQAKIEGSLSVSQRQAVIKLLEKKTYKKKTRYMKNWRPIS